jgi:hypothetical protein
MRVRALCFVVVVAAIPHLAAATPFTATYSFVGQPGDETSVAITSNPTGTVFDGIVRGSGLTAISGINSINSEAWTTAATLDPNDYYQFAVTPVPGYDVDLDQIIFSERRSGQGVITIDLRSSLDGYTSSLFSAVLPDDTITRRFTVNLPSTFDDLAAPVTFRFFGYAAQDGRGTWRLGTAPNPDNPSNAPANLLVVGDATPIPEPATLTLSVIGVTGAVIRRRRRVRS